MTASATQVVELAKQGFSSEQIADALSLPMDAVDSIVLKDTQAVKELDKCGALEGKFENLEDLAMTTLEHMIKFCETDSERGKLIRYILDQRLGLKKPKERNTIINNYHFLVEKARKAKEKAASVVVEMQAA